MRDKLKELIENAPVWKNGTFGEACEFVADHLIENGVIVPPCKVGDTVYIIEDSVDPSGKCKGCEYLNLGYTDLSSCGIEHDDYCRAKECIEITEEIVTLKNIYLWLWLDCFGNSIFLTKEEAEKALRGEGE